MHEHTHTYLHVYTRHACPCKHMHSAHIHKNKCNSIAFCPFSDFRCVFLPIQLVHSLLLLKNWHRFKGCAPQSPMWNLVLNNTQNIASHFTCVLLNLWHTHTNTHTHFSMELNIHSFTHLFPNSYWSPTGGQIHHWALWIGKKYIIQFLPSKTQLILKIMVKLESGL